MRAAIGEVATTSGPGVPAGAEAASAWRRDASDAAAAAAGDVEAFERVYRANVGRVHALCLRMTGDRAVAEELTQEAFLRAWRKLSSFRGGSALSSWLFRLTVNLVISSRRVRRSPAALEPVTDEGAAGGPTAVRGEPADRLDLERAIARLPHGARAVFVLHDVEGLSHDEVAAVAGISAGTSKAQLHRARRLLREALR